MATLAPAIQHQCTCAGGKGTFVTRFSSGKTACHVASCVHRAAERAAQDNPNEKIAVTYQMGSGNGA